MFLCPGRGNEVGELVSLHLVQGEDGNGVYPAFFFLSSAAISTSVLGRHTEVLSLEWNYHEPQVGQQFLVVGGQIAKPVNQRVRVVKSF